MAKTISIHSFRGGTGKSNLTANIATTLALRGARVAVIDTDIQSPGVHVLFGQSNTEFSFALNDYLWDRCPIERTAHDVTPGPVKERGGTIHLIPSSLRPGEIARVLREGYDVARLIDGIRALREKLALDFLLIDTHPGLNEETLLSITMSDTLAVVVRPDSQDYQGTAVTLEVARRLDVPRIQLIVNKIPAAFPVADVVAKIESIFGERVCGALPMSDDMLQLASADLFVLRHPSHPFTRAIESVAEKLAQ
jgi:MinD-like ATPase involved in chromosome partitioning or flagellar assembly